MSLLEELSVFVRDNVAPHLAGQWSPHLECQLLLDGRPPKRIPDDRNGKPRFDDDPYISLNRLTHLGVTGWQWTEERSQFCKVDIDSQKGHSGGHGDEVLTDLIERIQSVPEAEITRSRSGNGYHICLYFADPPQARTGTEHEKNCLRAAQWLSERIGIDLLARHEGKRLADKVGGVCWIWSRERGERGFELVKASTANLILPPSAVTTEVEPQPVPEPVADTDLHKQFADYLIGRGEAEFDRDGRLQTHTFHVAAAVAHFGWPKLQTTSTGKDGTAGRNCWLMRRPFGGWAIYRHDKGCPEHKSWRTSKNGWTTIRIGPKREKPEDPAAMLVQLAADDDLFIDSTGRAWATTPIRGRRETVLLGESKYKARLRLAYSEATGRIALKEQINNAIAELEAQALMRGPEREVALRLGRLDGAIWIDLADTERRIVRVTAKGWSVEQDCPIRFRRPPGTLPLPVPVAGGSLADLLPFLNVEEHDLPLLVGFMVGCFSDGPFPILQLVGEKGSAKSTLARLIHDFTDPCVAVCGNMPGNSKSLLVAAQSRRLLSFDNLSGLSKQESDWLCKLSTGSAELDRKLFTDQDVSILRSKNPIILTSIRDVVVAQDLTDRTLTIELQPIPESKRTSEYAYYERLRADKLRERIFGWLLDGVVAALAGHQTVKTPMPRMADFFCWATAAEKALGIKPVVAAYNRNADGAIDADSHFAERVRSLCETGFRGSPTEFAKKVNLGLNARQAADELREIAGWLRRQSFQCKQFKTHGKKTILLGDPK